METGENVRSGQGGIGNIMSNQKLEKRFGALNQELISISNLEIMAGDKKVVKGVNLRIGQGEIHVLMGPNGSGKSSLALAIAGHQNYKVTGGKIAFCGVNLQSLKPEERAKEGLFLAFQNPIGLAGVSLFNFLKTALDSQKKKIKPAVLLTKLRSLSARVGLGDDFLKRDLNLDFSGGERKRSEVFQALALGPKFAIFDEPDSGLDLDALKVIAKEIKDLAKQGAGILLITHNPRVLLYLQPHFVHAFVDGRVVESGGLELAQKLEKNGYKDYA